MGGRVGVRIGNLSYFDDTAQLRHAQQNKAHIKIRKWLLMSIYFSSYDDLLPETYSVTYSHIWTHRFPRDMHKHGFLFLFDDDLINVKVTTMQVGYFINLHLCLRHRIHQRNDYKRQ